MKKFDIRKLDMALLLIFLGLMRERNVTLVARRLGMTQSTVSHALNRLREAFGDPLFTRTSRGVEPTARAFALAPIIAQLIETLETAAGAPAFDAATADGAIRIAALDNHCAMFAAPMIETIRRTAPRLRLVFRPLGGQLALEALQANEADIALGFFGKMPSSIERAELYNEGYVVLARRNHPAVKRTLSLAAYVRADHIVVSQRGELSGIVDHALAGIGHSRNVIATVPYFMAALTAVAESNCIVTIPRRLGLAAARRFELRAMKPPLPIRSFAVSALWHRRDANSSRRRWIVDQLTLSASRFAD